ncbi:MAG: glycosyl transferase [Thermus sp.]|uniref:glycosyltransferase family 2 protein n=1 Tax=Thermus sp. TaxID=275 RepID=UPI003328271A
MRTPLVSIVVNNYNYGRFLHDAIESAINQTYSNVEVIVVDDGSTDDSREIISQYAEKGQVVPVFKENGGQASAFNAGFKVSRGEVIIFLDADDILLPHCVAKALEAWTPSCTKVQWRMALVDQEKKLLGRVWPPLYQPMLSGNLQDLVFRWCYYPTPPTSGNAFSRWFLESVLPMPEAEWRIDADSYLLILAATRGEIQSIDSILSLYRVHGTNLWFNEKGDQKKLERILKTDLKKEELVRAEGKRIGYSGRIGASPAVLKLRLFFCLQAPNKIEKLELTCNKIHLALNGVLASIFYPFGPGGWFGRAVQALWFVSVSILPSRWTKRWMQWAIAPIHRPSWLLRLLGLGGGVSVDAPTAKARGILGLITRLKGKYSRQSGGRNVQK